MILIDVKNHAAILQKVIGIDTDSLTRSAGLNPARDTFIEGKIRDKIKDSLAAEGVEATVSTVSSAPESYDDISLIPVIIGFGVGAVIAYLVFK